MKPEFKQCVRVGNKVMTLRPDGVIADNVAPIAVCESNMAARRISELLNLFYSIQEPPEALFSLLTNSHAAATLLQQSMKHSKEGKHSQTIREIIFKAQSSIRKFSHLKLPS